MFEELRRSIENKNISQEAACFMMEAADGGDFLDDMLEDIAISTEEEKRIEDSVDKIPDDDFEVSPDGKITDKALEKQLSKVIDPTIEELAEE